jgi:DNA-binding response OmpR family regulator
VRLAEGWVPSVLCIGLQGLDGFSLARHLRQNLATAAVRLVGITDYDDEEICQLAHESGFDHVLFKPTDAEELLRLLAASA